MARTFKENDLRNAVNHSCTCGGKAPFEEGVCPACTVWHLLYHGDPDLIIDLTEKVDGQERSG